MSSVSLFHVFAYGSNLHLNRMQHRAPSARPVSIGYVKGRKFEFRKRSDDGSAKADAKFTGNPADRVWGAIYRLNSRDKCSLDKHESLGVGYDESPVNVHVSSGRVMHAMLYEARKEMVDGSLHPYSWYLEFVRHGALQHCLPYCYINREISLISTADPNKDRSARNRNLLRSS